MDSVTLDALDVRLLHALQIDGRAPFSRIAEVLGVSDRTVARRYGRLSAAGLARVVGVTLSEAVGHAEWLVRFRVLPADAAPVARALARRPDTAWVTVAAGGTEIVCLFLVSHGGSAPLDTLGRDWPLAGVDAYRLLHPVMRHRRWRGRTSALTADEVSALRPSWPPDTAGRRVALTALDRQLLPALAAHGRAALPELARHVGWSESAVRRRLDELRRSRALQFDVEVDPRLFGFTVQCLLWLTVTPSRLSDVTEALTTDTETAFVATITGTHNVVAIAICRDAGALHTYLTERIRALEGIERLETTPVDSYAKRRAPAANANLSGPGLSGTSRRLPGSA
ncbi:Lrp/AsnC family transcriptional regulator [Yinghuangia sp. YIM S10712]|uniref:Lrp/AsnC family transcriptional regulator n=1 Tax=Yinghuangia sp. YIM S10712 TaxID=3436930 RepID=UPI003F53ABC7